MNSDTKFRRTQYIIFEGQTLYYIKGVRTSRSLDRIFDSNKYYIVDMIGRITKDSSDHWSKPYTRMMDKMCRLATPTEVLLYGKTRS